MQTQLRLHSKQHLFQACFSSFSFNAPNRKTNIRILSGSKREQRKLWFRDCCHKIGISSVVFNSSCFLVRFNYEVLSIHIYFYNLSNGITVKWIRNICFKDIETSTLVEKIMLIYQNLGWCTEPLWLMHTYYTSSPTCRIEFIAWKFFKRNLWNVFLFSWHDDLNLKQFIPIDQHCWEGSLLFLLLSVLYILVCSQFLPSNIFCQCIVTLFYQHIKLYTKNDVTN